MADITNRDDVINVCDITDRVEELRDKRASLPYDIEVFWHDGERTSEDDCWADSDGKPLPEGWYYWTCLPGCMPEGDPIGPYPSEEEAEQAATEEHGEDEFEEGEEEELATLETLLSDLQGNGGDHQWEGDWYPVTLIRDSHFKDYARDYAEDVGAINRDASWPNNCIDWDRAARELQVDYSSVEFDGVTYWYR